MNQDCPYIEKCPMFKYFQTDFAKEIYMRLYCRDKFGDCERKKLRDAGAKAPDRMLPDGHYL